MEKEKEILFLHGYCLAVRVLMIFIFFYKVAFLFFKIIFIYFFRERGREGEREGEKHQCVVASHTPPTGDLSYNPGMCPD